MFFASSTGINCTFILAMAVLPPLLIWNQSLITAESASDAIVDFQISFLFVVFWLIYDFIGFISFNLPVPVNLNLFFEELCVLILGISLFPPLSIY